MMRRWRVNMLLIVLLLYVCVQTCNAVEIDQSLPVVNSVPTAGSAHKTQGKGVSKDSAKTASGRSNLKTANQNPAAKEKNLPKPVKNKSAKARVSKGASPNKSVKSNKSSVEKKPATKLAGKNKIEKPKKGKKGGSLGKKSTSTVKGSGKKAKKSANGKKAKVKKLKKKAQKNSGILEDFPPLPPGRQYVAVLQPDGSTQYVVEVLHNHALEKQRAAQLQKKIKQLQARLAKVQHRLNQLSKPHFSNEVENELGHLLNKAYYSGKLEVKVQKAAARSPLDINNEMQHALSTHFVKTKKVRSVMTDSTKRGNKKGAESDHLVLERRKQPGGQLGTEKRHEKHKVFSSGPSAIKKSKAKSKVVKKKRLAAKGIQVKKTKKTKKSVKQNLEKQGKVEGVIKVEVLKAKAEPIPAGNPKVIL